MRLLSLGLYYYPEQTAVAPFATGRAEYLAAAGHDVTVCTAMPFYPQWRIDPAYRGRLYSTEKRNGVKILRSLLYVPNPVTSAKRIIHEASFLVSTLVRLLGRQRPELIFVTSPPLTLGLAGVILSRLWQVPFVFHVADLQPDSAVDLGMLRPGRIVKALYGLERFIYRKAALVSTLTTAMQRKIVSKGISSDKVTLFSDWSEPALFDVPLAGGGNEFRRAYDIGDRFLVVHSGNMGVKQGLEVVLAAAEQTRSRSEILYLLVGDGAVREHLQALARFSDLQNLRFLPLLPVDVFRDMLGAVDVSLITQQQSVADIVFPSKVLTLLSSGRPVVASISSNSQVAHVLTESGAGLIVEAENPHALAESVTQLQPDEGRRHTMGKRGRIYARQHWDRQTQLEHLEATFRNLVNDASAAGLSVAPGRQSPCAKEKGRPRLW